MDLRYPRHRRPQGVPSTQSVAASATSRFVQYDYCLGRFTEHVRAARTSRRPENATRVGPTAEYARGDFLRTRRRETTLFRVGRERMARGISCRVCWFVANADVLWFIIHVGAGERRSGTTATVAPHWIPIDVEEPEFGAEVLQDMLSNRLSLDAADPDSLPSVLGRP